MPEEPDLSELIKDPVMFCETLLDIHPFPYQAEFLRDESKRIVLCAGRQIGKSFMTSARMVWFALTHEKTTSLVVSATLRQSMLMFQKIVSCVQSSAPMRNSISYMSRTTVRFKNRSEIKALPCGMTGFSVRGHTAHLIIIDEASFMPERVIAEVILPMLSTTDGTAIMLSTPFDKNHIFYRAFTSPSWSKYHYISSVNPLIKLEFLEEQKQLIGEQRFAQEYLAEFLDDQKAYFPMTLIREAVHSCTSSPCAYCRILSGQSAIERHAKAAHLFGGYDPGGKQDPGAFVVVERLNDDNKTLRVLLQKTYLSPKNSKDENLYTRFTAQIADLHGKLKFREIFVDQTGIGQPIIEHCKELKLPAVGIMLSARSREDVLSNLRIQFEQKRIVLPNGDLNLLANLNCVEVERTRSGGYSFSHPSGTHDDLAYALALAVWGASGRTSTVAILKAIPDEKASWRQGL